MTASTTNLRRPTAIMMKAVNLEFEGKTAEAVRLLEEHKDESEMHQEEFLMHFFEARRAKELGPYDLNGVNGNGKAPAAREVKQRRRAVPGQAKSTRKAVARPTGRPTKVMMLAVNCELEGKHAAALQILKDHKAESRMHTADCLQFFVESRKARGLGPYSIEGSDTQKQTKIIRPRPRQWVEAEAKAKEQRHYEAWERAQARKAERRAQRRASAAASTDILSAIDVNTSLGTLIMLEAKVAELLSKRDRAEVERARKAVQEVDELRKRLAEAQALLGEL